jgi:sarcosine oxidase subunit gamma
MSERENQRDVRITERGPSGMVTLHGDLGSTGLQTAVRALTGCAMPDVRKITFHGDRAVAWMSPDELILFSTHEDAAGLAADLADALKDSHHLAVDVSDARAVFRLTGPGARAVLAKGAPVDLAPDAFGPGDFRRTRLGQVAAAFWMVEYDVFDLMCFRSVGGFVGDWLENAAVPASLPEYFRA